jgi:hypothetical protein
MKGTLMSLARATRRRAGRPFARTRWLALGAVIAIVIGAGGMNAALATISTGDRGAFVDVSPKRIADTRFNIGISGQLASGVPKLLKVTGSVPIAPSGSATVVPAGATAVVLNVTAVNPTRSGFVSVRPGDATGSPTTSNLNVVAGVNVPNSVTVGLPTAGGNAGKIQIWYQGSGGGSTHILVDVVGYYDNHTHDDRYYTKSQTLTKAETKDLVFDQRTFVGAIQGDGAKLDNGAYTTFHVGTGDNIITFDTTGLGISGAQMPPNVTASPSYFCAIGTSLQADWQSTTTSTEVIEFEVRVKTFTAAGAAVDCDVQFHINLASPPSLVLGHDAAAPDSMGGDFPAGTTVKCENEPSGPVCKPAG